jgi:hypothetical protein
MGGEASVQHCLAMRLYQWKRCVVTSPNRGAHGHLFFFEKKNQKTFAPLKPLCGNRRVQMIKSFLLLFFKKEVLP